MYKIGLVAIVGAMLWASGRAACAQATTSRQVTVFGILAVPNSEVLDPKLKSIAPQLRQLFPNHGFKLLGVETKRIDTGESHTCDLGDGFAAQTQLVTPMDDNGKVTLRFQLNQDGQMAFASLVTTPPNQLSFAEKQLPDGSRLVIGIGVRP